MYKKNIISSALTQVGRIFLSFLLNVIVARVLGSTALGRVNYFFVVFGIIASYGHFGVLNGISYCYKKDKCDSGRQFRTNITYLIGNCIMWFALLSLPFVRELLLPDFPYFFVVLGVMYVLVVYLNSAYTEYCVGDEKVYTSNRAYLLGLFLAVVAIVTSQLLGCLSAEVYIVCKILEYLVAVMALVIVLKMKYRPCFDFDFFKREIKYGNIVFWSALFIFLTYRVDQIMIKFWMGDSELGVYSIAVSLAELVFLIPLSITSAVTGKLLNMKDDKKQKEKVLCLTVKICLYLSILISVFGACCTPLIPVVYGTEYEGAIGCFLVLLPGVCVASIAKVMAPYYLTGGQPKIHFYVTLLTLMINVICNIIFIPSMGKIGAALGSTIAYVVYGVTYVMLFVFKEHTPVRKMLLLDKEDVLLAGKAIKKK